MLQQQSGHHVVALNKSAQLARQLLLQMKWQLAAPTCHIVESTVFGASIFQRPRLPDEFCSRLLNFPLPSFFTFAHCLEGRFWDCSPELYLLFAKNLTFSKPSKSASCVHTNALSRCAVAKMMLSASGNLWRAPKAAASRASEASSDTTRPCCMTATYCIATPSPRCCATFLNTSSSEE